MREALSVCRLLLRLASPKGAQHPQDRLEGRGLPHLSGGLDQGCHRAGPASGAAAMITERTLRALGRPAHARRPAGRETDMIPAFAGCVEVPPLRFILRQEPLWLTFGHNNGNRKPGQWERLERQMEHGRQRRRVMILAREQQSITVIAPGPGRGRARKPLVLRPRSGTTFRQ